LKNIGIDARFLLRPIRGIPLYVVRLCQLLPALRPDYRFWFFINKGFEHNDTPANYQARLDEVVRDRANVTVVNYDSDAEVVWEQVYLPRMVKEHGIDLLHMPGNRIPFFSGVPTVVTVHDVMELVFMKTGLLQKLRSCKANPRAALYALRQELYIWLNYRLGFRKASGVLTVSNYSAAEIHRLLGIPGERVFPIHHGLDDEFTLPNGPGSLSRERRKNVLMLGGDVIHKNAEGALAAWSRVRPEVRKRFPLKIIGFCGNDQSPLMKALRANNLVDEVEVVGWVSQEVLVQELRAAALFLYLSRYEGFGFPPLHAMASGTPVVVSNVTSIPEVVGDVGLKYCPDDHDGIASGMERVLCDEQLWYSQAIAGIKRANGFSWESSARKHLQVYEETMRHP